MICLSLKLWLFWGFCCLLYNLCLGSGTKISLSLCLPVMIHTWMFTWYRWEGESWEETQRQFDIHILFRPLIRSIGLHHGKIQSLKLLSYWGNLKTRKIPLTERGDLKSSWIYRILRSTTKEALSLCTYWIWPSLSEILFFSLSPAGCQILEVWNLCRVLKTISPNRPGGLEEISHFKGTWSIQLILSIKDK